MERPSLVVVSYDGLGVGALGPYGNTWAATPAWNELAARGRVFDFVFANGCALSHAANSWWQGRHPLESSDSAVWLPAAFDTAGITSTLFSDDEPLLRTSTQGGWSRQVQLSEPAPSDAAANLEATAIVRQSQVACAEIAKSSSPFFTWVHLSALGSPWDVPHEFRVNLSDEDDPPVPTFVDVPAGGVELDDHDTRWSYQLAYAAQMTAVDASLGWFLDVIDDVRHRQPVVFAVTSPRGFALGAHGTVGLPTDDLRSETLQVPLIIDWPDDPRAGQRVAAIYDSVAVHHLLSQGLAEPPAAGTLPPSLGRAMSVSAAQRSFRTPAWFLRETKGAGQYELFAKPDDRWDANEISIRCPETVVQLREAMEQFANAAAKGTLAECPPLDEALR